jgi:type VI secretion system protein ImpC
MPRRDTSEKTAAATRTAPAVAASQSPLLDQIIQEGRVGRDDASRERGKGMIAQFVRQILDGQMTVAPDTEAMIQARIAQIDHLLSLQLNEVLHNPKFQKMEASWRGIWYLMENSETGVNLKLKVFNATKKEVLRDLQRVPEFDQSQMFKKVYEQEFGVFGGEPFACILGDYEFGRGSEDIEFLERMSAVAAAAHAPFISAASAELMNLESFTQLDTPRDMAKIFRMSEDSRYVCLTLPHILMRVPYGKDNRSVDAFNYEEGVTGEDHSQYLWGNAAYALGARITNAFARYGWCAAIRGVEGGGLVDSLPSHTFRTEEGDVSLKCPTETIITDRREKELSDLGFAPLVHCKGTDYAAFFSVQTCQKAKIYDTEQANANARLSAQLPYMLAVSRFAHYLKAMMRDKIGSFTSRKECEVFLNNWIINYVTEDDTASHDTKAKYPLREARVEVVDDKSKPGVFKAVAFLRPHFQLEELSVSLRLVAELPKSTR